MTHAWEGWRGKVGGKIHQDIQKEALKNSFSRVFVSLVVRGRVGQDMVLPPILSASQKPLALEPLSGLHGQITGET